MVAGDTIIVEVSDMTPTTVRRTQFGGLLSFLSFCLGTIFFALVVFNQPIRNWNEMAIGAMFIGLAFVLGRLGA